MESYLEFSGFSYLALSTPLKWTHQINQRSEKSAIEGCAWPGPMCELTLTSWSKPEKSPNGEDDQDDQSLKTDYQERTCKIVHLSQ